MIVKLKDVQQNPYRDIRCHPIDEERVQDLMRSINDFNFWGGMPGRVTEDGVIQLAAGHHRLEAAKRSGIKEADLPILEGIPDSEMVRMLAFENGTQSDLAASNAGSVAAAIRLAARSLATGKPEQMFAHSKRQKVWPKDHTFSNIELGQWVKEFEDGEGIGRRLLTKILSDVPGMNDSIIREQIGFLKAAGHYQRIINEVKIQIQQDRQRAIKEAEEAEAAEREAHEAEQRAAAKQKKEAAKKRAEAAAASEERAGRASKKADTPITVHPDVQGILKEATLVDQFRLSVTKPDTAKFFPVAEQPELARKLVEAAKSKLPGKRLTASFIRDNITTLARDERTEGKRRDKASQEEREQRSMVDRYERQMHEFSVAWRRVGQAARELHGMEANWPRGLEKPYDPGYLETVRMAHEMLSRLYAMISKQKLVRQGE
jgi:hypothetical protein